MNQETFGVRLPREIAQHILDRAATIDAEERVDLVSLRAAAVDAGITCEVALEPTSSTKIIAWLAIAFGPGILAKTCLVEGRAGTPRDREWPLLQVISSPVQFRVVWPNRWDGLAGPATVIEDCRVCALVA